MTNKNNIVLLPALKRYHEKDLTESNVDELTNFYYDQLMKQLGNHGVVLSKSFTNDMRFAHESLRSAISRTMGSYHPLQDYVDEVITQQESNKDDDEQ